MAILSAKADHLNAIIEDSVLELIAKRVQKNVRELEGSLNRVVASAQADEHSHNAGVNVPDAGRPHPGHGPATPLTRSASWKRWRANTRCNSQTCWAAAAARLSPWPAR